jgi:Ni,Fe-hydrogenase III large subunit
MARALVRRVEINEAHEKVLKILDGEVFMPPQSENKIASKSDFTLVVSTVEAWRGPLVHAAIFSSEGKMVKYKIVDPSAHNWQALAWAMRGEQISNFPICNKSFNLSYCGTDR